MGYLSTYPSPLGELLLSAEERGLTGIWFDGQEYYAKNLPEDCKDGEPPAILAAKRWMDSYFTGRDPGFSVPLHLIGTAFQKRVWEILLTIPYGKTRTYGDIARQLAKETGIARMSAQAVGNAVGHNNISIYIPCHRVVGANGSLTGYAAGLEKKQFLLKLENGYQSGFFLPKKGKAL